MDKLQPPSWRSDIPTVLPFGIGWLLLQKAVLPDGHKVLAVRPRPDGVDPEVDDPRHAWEKAEGCEMHMLFDNNECIDKLIADLEDLKTFGDDVGLSNRDQERQSIVDNIAGLVERREANRTKRKLKTGDQVTEAIKQIGLKIATGQL